MDKKIEEERTSILRVLDKEDSCISISTIASHTGINRHAVARHMDSLEMLGKVRKLEVGRAKKYLLVKKIPEYGLIDISTDLIFIVNPQLSVQYLNEAAARHFKTSLQECIGKDIRTLKFHLLLHRDFVKAINSFTYEKPEKVTLQDANGFWFEITLLGFSLLVAPNQIAIICTDITDKKRAEIELKIAQEKYIFAFHASPDGVVMRDIKTGEILEANPSYCRIIGHPMHEIIGKTPKDLNLFESPDYHIFITQKIIQSKSAEYRYELRLRKKSGELIDVSCSACIIHLPDRDCLLILTRDISEQKVIEEKIRTSEKLYRLLADNTQDVIWTLDPVTFSFTYISPSIKRLIGLPPEIVLKKKIQEIFTHESYLRMAVKLPYYMRSHMDGRNPSYCRLRVYYSGIDGTVIPTEVAISFVKDSTGEIVQILGVCRDISLHLDILKKLRRSEQHYKLLAESIKDVVWILDPVYRTLRYISPSVTKLTGWTPTELYQIQVEDIISPDMVDFFISECSRRYALFLENDRKQYYTNELKILTKNGDLLWIEINSHTSRNEETGAIEIIGISRDITEKRCLHQILADNEAQFRLIFNNMRDVFWSFDLISNKIMYISPSIYNLRGYYPDEIIGLTIDELYSMNYLSKEDNYIQEIKDQIKKFSDGDESARYQRISTIYRHRNGSLISGYVCISLIADSDKKVTQVIGVLHEISDLTDQKDSLSSGTSNPSGGFSNPG